MIDLTSDFGQHGAARLAQEWGRTIDDLYQEYSVAIRVVPDRLRGFH